MILDVNTKETIMLNSQVVWNCFARAHWVENGVTFCLVLQG